MTDKAKFRYSAQDGILELEGTEEFVSKHFENITDIVRVMARHAAIEQKTEAILETAEPIQSNSTAAVNSKHTEQLLDYPHVYSQINGKLKLVCEAKGESVKVQMTNVALLYCYGAALMGDEQVTSKDIRFVCEEHGCLDGANFSKIFDDKTIFISDGVKGGIKQIKLTFQGVKKAKDLLIND